MKKVIHNFKNFILQLSSQSSCSLNQDIIFTMTAVSKSLHFSKRVSTLDAFRFNGQQSNFDSRKGNSGKPYIRTIVCTLSDAFGN